MLARYCLSSVTGFLFGLSDIELLSNLNRSLSWPCSEQLRNQGVIIEHMINFCQNPASGFFGSRAGLRAVGVIDLENPFLRLMHGSAKITQCAGRHVNCIKYLDSLQATVFD